MPGATPEPPVDDGAASLIVGAVDVAMKTFKLDESRCRHAADDADFSARAAVILADLRKLETVVACCSAQPGHGRRGALALRTVAAAATTA